MRISTKDWNNYIRMLSQLNNKAGELMRDYVAHHGFEDTDAIIDYAYGLVTKYGEGSAALAAEMYDATAALSDVTVPPAEVAETASHNEVAKAINGTIKHSTNPNSCGNTVSRLVKRAGADTTLKNAKRDGAQFAWVPMGDTCPFCLTLASRGFQYISSKSLKNGHAEHIHANCDCAYTVRFDNTSGVKGYNPQVYKDMYDNAEGRTSKEKINSMRRKYYEENKDKINAQKRAAYAASNVSEKLKNNLPSKYIDKRKIGAPISKKDLDAISSIAKKAGIQLGRDGLNIEFDTYCGNPEVLKTFIEYAAKRKDELGIKKLILEYDNVLGYEGDKSKIDIGAFAETTKNTIRLNKFMFDDSVFLIDQYNQAVKKHIFAPGTSYINIIDHEYGHILYRTHRELYVNAINALKKEADSANLSLEKYIKDNISIYASSVQKDGKYTELLPELNSMANGKKSSFALRILGRRDV